MSKQTTVRNLDSEHYHSIPSNWWLNCAFRIYFRIFANLAGEQRFGFIKSYEALEVN